MIYKEPSHFYLEFLQELEIVLCADLDAQPSTCRFGIYNLRNSLLNYLWYNRLPFRDEYCRLRISGKTPSEALKSLRLPVLCGKKNAITAPCMTLSDHPWSKIAGTYRDRLLIFALGHRNLEYLAPVIRHISVPSILLHDSEEYVDIPQGQDMLQMKFAKSGFRRYDNGILERLAVDFHYVANSLCWIAELFRPSGFLCIDGCQTHYKLMSEFIGAQGKPTVCLQQGWPSILHQGFKDMPYSHFLTWGEWFSEAFSTVNPQMKFMVGGYPYNVCDSGMHSAITFFMQDAVFIGSRHLRYEMIEIACAVARVFPDRDVFIRDHPSLMNAPKVDFERFRSFQNIYDGGCIPLSELYLRSCVVVSQYSSSLVESIIHGCIPVVYNPVAEFLYSPAICWMASNVHSAIKKIRAALSVGKYLTQINRLDLANHTGDIASRIIASEIDSIVGG